jgi:hypothetical protein
MGSFSVSWHLRSWSDEGVAHDDRVIELVEATDAWHARDAIRRRTIERTGWPRRPFRLAFDGDPLELTQDGANYPATVPHRHVLRGRVLDGTSPVTLMLELRASGATRLEILIAFAEAFDLPPEKAIEALDAIVQRQHIWSRPFRIREAFEHGGSVMVTLHQIYRDGTCANSIGLFVALRDALDLEFNDTKLLIDLACNEDPSFERKLTAALARRR